MPPAPILSILPYRIGGGPAVQHLNFLRALDPDRFEVHVLLPEEQPHAEAFAGVSAAVHTIPETTLVPRSTSPRALARYLRRAREERAAIEQIGRGAGVRLVHTFGEAFPTGVWAGRRLGVPTVVHVIGMSIFEPVWVAAAYSRVLRSIGDRLVCCQGVIADLLHRHGVPRDRLRVVHNGIDADRVRMEAQSGPAPDLPEQGLRVGTVAGLDPRKGHLNFVQAAAEVASRRDDVRFYVIGRLEGNPGFLGEVRAAIETAGLSSRFHLVGAVENAAAWIDSMHVYCIPSLSEALSVAGLEAMALAKPVVATRVGGNPEAVADGETGLLAAPADPSDLAAKLLRVLADAEARHVFGEAGRERVDARFTLAHNAAALAAVFEELLGGGQGVRRAGGAGPGSSARRIAKPEPRSAR